VNPATAACVRWQDARRPLCPGGSSPGEERELDRLNQSEDRQIDFARLDSKSELKCCMIYAWSRTRDEAVVDLPFNEPS